MRLDVVAQLSADDRHVGLGLRGVVERDRCLGTDIPALAEGPRECPFDEPDRGVVRRALGLRHYQQAVDQLDALARLEDSLVDEPLVLEPLPPSDLELRSGHESLPSRKSSDARRLPSMSPDGDTPSEDTRRLVLRPSVDRAPPGDASEI